MSFSETARYAFAEAVSAIPLKGAGFSTEVLSEHGFPFDKNYPKSAGSSLSHLKGLIQSSLMI